MNLAELDAFLDAIDLPVRRETLTAAWDQTPTQNRPRRVVLLVSMRARPGSESLLDEAAKRFVAATARLAGSLGSTLHRSSEDPATLYLLERFATEESFARHMASEYFSHFQREQAGLLAGPVSATFLERAQ